MCLQPILDKVCTRLQPWIAGWIISTSRLVLIKSVLTSIPVYHSIAMNLPVWLIQAFQKRIRAFFWKGTDVVSGGHCMVAWD